MHKIYVNLLFTTQAINTNAGFVYWALYIFSDQLFSKIVTYVLAQTVP